MKAKPITPEEMTAYVEATWEKCQEQAWQEPTPKREWVGLTDAEIYEITCHVSLVRYFETKLKEKNT